MRPVLLLAALNLALPALAAEMLPTPIATAGKTAVAPALDGVLDDACWARDAAVLRGFVSLDGARSASPPTDARLCWDDARLYVGVRCVEPQVKSLLARCTARDDGVWRDDCVELFLDTNLDRTSYYHVIVNSIGTVYDETVPGGPAWNADLQVAARVGEDEWTVELAIPWSDLGGAPESGATWGVNVGRERYAGATDLSAWSSTYGTFLVPDRFGTLRFAEQPGGLAWELPAEPGFGRNELFLRTAREAVPALSLRRDWPAGLERTWETPAPTVATAPQVEVDPPLTHGWTGSFRLVDGSETALVIEQSDGGSVLFRQALPLSLTPPARTAQLAREALALSERIATLPALREELDELVTQVRVAVADFVAANLERDDALTPAQWAAEAAIQQGLLARITGLSYISWTQSPLLGLERTQMPASLRQESSLMLSACVNEVECAALNVSNLSMEPFEGRVTVDDLRLVAPVGAEVDAANLLTNADFAADEDADGIPDGWIAVGREGSWALEPQGDGSTAFVLSGTGPTQVNFRQNVDLEPGKTYTLIAEISAQDLPPGAAYVHVINQGWTWSTAVAPITPTSARSEYSRSFTAPDSPRFQVVLRLDSPADGVVRFHRVRLIEGGVEEVTFAPECITLHQAEYQDLRVGRTVADPLPVMNEAGMLRVAPGESRQVFLTVDTSALPPGEYATTVRIKPCTRERPLKAVPMRVRVLPVRLPERMPIATYNWDYAANERYVEDLVAHHTNSFLLSTSCRMNFDAQGEPTGPVDWASYDQMLQVKLRHARANGGIIVFSYGIVRDFETTMRSAHGWEFMSEPWRRAFRAWVLEFERHLRDDIGMGYEEYAVQLWDEATGANAHLTLEAGQFLRSFAPRMRLCMDGAQSPDEVRMLDPVIDLWIPHWQALRNRDSSPELRALYAEIAARGEPVWHYTCNTNMKALDPLDYYRLKEWQVWELGLGGSCYWAYNSWRGDPWDDFDGEIADCGAIYDGPGAPITSRRWEATRDGREDYQALHLLREAGRAAGGETTHRVQAFIDALVAEVLAAPTDVAVFERARGRLLDVLAEHCGANPPVLTTEPGFAVTPGEVRVTWVTDRPTEGLLRYRIPGDARWRELRFDHAPAHDAILTDLPARRSVEWYLLWWDDTGATGANVSGLMQEGWFATR